MDKLDDFTFNLHESGSDLHILGIGSAGTKLRIRIIIRDKWNWHDVSFCIGEVIERAMKGGK